VRVAPVENLAEEVAQELCLVPGHAVRRERAREVVERDGREPQVAARRPRDLGNRVRERQEAGR